MDCIEDVDAGELYESESTKYRKTTYMSSRKGKKIFATTYNQVKFCLLLRTSHVHAQCRTWNAGHAIVG